MCAYFTRRSENFLGVRCYPGGRPRDVHGIAALARTFSAEAIEKLVELMRDKTMPPRAVIAAIDSILDRGLGKPMQPMQQQHLDADGKPISPVFNVRVSQYPEPEPPPQAVDGEGDTRH